MGIKPLRETNSKTRERGNGDSFGGSASLQVESKMLHACVFICVYTYICVYIYIDISVR